MAKAGPGFDIATLSTADQRTVDSCAAAIHDFIGNTTRDAHRIGLQLKAVKKLLGHGHFTDWLRAEFRWSVDTAERLMKVAERFTQIPQAAEISLTAMYILAG